MRKNILKNAPPETLAEIDRLRGQVQHAEAHGQMDTCHHAMLARAMSQLNLITSGKIEEHKEDEVNNGEPNL